MSEQQEPSAEAAGRPAPEPQNGDDSARDNVTSSHPRSATESVSPRRSTNDADDRSRSPAPNRRRDRSRSPSRDRYQNNHRKSNGRYGHGRGGDRYKRHDRADRKNKEYEHLQETNDPVQIREQVEFYYGEANIRQDQHMFVNLVQGSRNMPVPIKELHKFTRMRRFQPYKDIVAALRDSDILNVLDSGEFAGHGNEAVQLKEPLKMFNRPDDGSEMTIEEEFSVGGMQPDPILHHKLPTSIYVKDFGDDKISQLDLESFFKPYGAIEVRKRCDKDSGAWKGSVFVQFATAEEQEQFVEQKPQYKGRDLHIETKKAYCERKAHEKDRQCDWELDDDEQKRLFAKRVADKLSNAQGRPSYRGRGNPRGGNKFGPRHNGKRRGSPDYGPRRSNTNGNWNEDRDRFQNRRSNGRSEGGHTDRKRKNSLSAEEPEEPAKKTKVNTDKTEIMEDA